MRTMLVETVKGCAMGWAARCVLWSTPFLLASTILLAAPNLPAQEWSRFRGPNGSGINETVVVPNEWNDENTNWIAQLPGKGHSSPVLWGERIFLLSGDANSATRYVVCLSAESGRIVWNRSFASRSHHLHPRNTFASSTPCVDAERLYVAWSTPEKTTLLSLTHDGDVVWEKDLGRWVSSHGFGTSPMLWEDLVILNNSQQSQQLDPGQRPGDSWIMAFDRLTGEERWRTSRGSSRVCYTVPCIYEGDDGRDQLVCFNTTDGMFALDPAGGELLWTVPGVFDKRTVSSPVIAGGHIFGSTGSGGGGNYVAAVRPGERPRVAFRFVQEYAPYVPTPVARDHLLFLTGDRPGIMVCLDARDGRVLWEERVSTGFSSSPIRVRDKIVCVDNDGTAFVVAAEPEFRLLGENPLGETTRATPAAAGGRVYVRTETRLYSIGGEGT